MSENKNISGSLGTSTESFFTHDGIVEEEGRCILSITQDAAHGAASLQMVGIGLLGVVFLTFFLLPLGRAFLSGAMHDSSKNIVAIAICLMVLYALGSAVVKAMRTVESPSSPIVLSAKGITIPQQREEILWDDIHAIYFKRPTFGKDLHVYMYIDPKKGERLMVDDWALYASKEQWTHFLCKYAQRDIVINK